MGFTKKRLLVGCLVFGFLMFFGTVFAFIIWVRYSVERESGEIIEFNEKNRKRRTAETVGTITEYSESRATGKTYNNKYISYQFVVNGKTYTRENYVENGSIVTHHKGVEGKVCYEPSNPENARFSLKKENLICGQ